MEVLHPRCAGLDVHKDTVVVAVRLMEGDGTLRREVETFATTTPGLLALSDWLERHDCPSVAIEATGIYWRPIWHVLAAEEPVGRAVLAALAAGETDPERLRALVGPRVKASPEAIRLNLLHVKRGALDRQIQTAEANGGDPPVELQKRRAELTERLAHQQSAPPKRR